MTSNRSARSSTSIPTRACIGSSARPQEAGRRETSDDRGERRDLDQQEAPEDEQVVLRGLVLRTFLGDLLLSEEVDPEGDQPRRQLVEPRTRIGDSFRDGAAEQPHRPREEGERGRGQADKNHRVHARLASYHDAPFSQWRAVSQSLVTFPT